MNSESTPNDNKTIFSSGVESATLVMSSNLLRPPLEAILELYAENTSDQKLSFKVKKGSDLTIIAFVTKHHLEAPEQAGLVSSSALKDNNLPHFEFLCNKKTPSFSLNNLAISLFYEYFEQLHHLKSQIDSSMRLIVSGHGVGGSIASLFTLWLLDSKSSNKKPPLCITFGSPLLGDTSLQKCISQSSTWNSCFIHVASLRDPLPAFFTSNYNYNYKPFGTFLLCSDEGSACFNDPDSILKLLEAMRSTMITHPNQESHIIHHYAKIVQNLHRKAVCKTLIPSIPQNMVNCNSLEVGIILQLLALGLSQILQQAETLKKMKEGEEKLQGKKSFDPSKKLNKMKIHMARLEWYKKSAKSEMTGMYDKYKKQSGTSEQDITGWKKDLTIYWTDMMKEAQIKPMKEGASFRTRWLYAGTNYRRMVEPLDIADYYNSGGSDYVGRGRSSHYKQLEEWLQEDNSPSVTSNRQNVGSILTLDSCFWARVEEALIAACCDQVVMMKRENDDEFEEYVYGLLQSYAVSPEVFLEGTSFMRWWDRYKDCVTIGKDGSKLVRFMCDGNNYKLYAQGEFDFSRL